MCLDPRTKLATGIPPADCVLIWQYMEEELIELALDNGPPKPPVNNNHNPVLQNNQQAQNDYNNVLNEG
jgi:hypothetical protein